MKQGKKVVSIMVLLLAVLVISPGSYAAETKPAAAPDRTVLPIHKLQVPHSTVFDVRNATPHLSSRKRGFVIDKTGNFGRK